jgi:hypothetical protein
MGRYTGGEKSMRIRFTGSSSNSRAELSESTMELISESDNAKKLQGFATLILGNVRIQYTTAHFNGYIYNGYLGNDLLDGATFPTPLTERDKRDPHKEDEYIVEELFEHLNSNLEHYNKVLWRNLDPDRRYMLLDGFSIQIFDRSGNRLHPPRSLASVVKNDLITIVGNSLVFPVADGYHVSKTHIIDVEDPEETQPSLLDHYRPVREVEPYRLSVPTRGVYMESVMGQCDACEDVKEDSSQDWDRFRTEEPTAISPVITPTPTRTDWRAIWAQFAQPLIALQTAREAPAPGAGLQGLSETLANAEAFRDITGLAGNQENVIRTYLSNQENARAFAEMAKTMAMQEHNSENSRSIMESLDNAREQGAISEGDYSELVQDHLGQQIDGGARRQAEERRESGREPSLTNAAIDAVEEGREVTAQRTRSDGTAESVKVSKESGGSQSGFDSNTVAFIDSAENGRPDAVDFYRAFPYEPAIGMGGRTLHITNLRDSDSFNLEYLLDEILTVSNYQGPAMEPTGARDEDVLGPSFLQSRIEAIATARETLPPNILIVCHGTSSGFHFPLTSDTSVQANTNHLQTLEDRNRFDISEAATRIGISEAEVQRLRGKMLIIQQLEIERVDIRACNLGNIVSVLPHIQRFFNCGRVTAPIVADLFFSEVPINFVSDLSSVAEPASSVTRSFPSEVKVQLTPLTGNTYSICIYAISLECVRSLMRVHFGVPYGILVPPNSLTDTPPTIPMHGLVVAGHYELPGDPGYRNNIEVVLRDDEL